ncbi:MULTISPECIES: hypothetical protein [unclassified Streptomyces]|uniref:hypothetical protein n=1 Tax=unclassified Streptomyces TaxID=2593676 RepID=UPI0030772041
MKAQPCFPVHVSKQSVISRSPPLTASGTGTGPANTRTQKRVPAVLFAPQVLSGLLTAGSALTAGP